MELKDHMENMASQNDNYSSQIAAEEETKSVDSFMKQVDDYMLTQSQSSHRQAIRAKGDIPQVVPNTPQSSKNMSNYNNMIQKGFALALMEAENDEV